MKQEKQSGEYWYCICLATQIGTRHGTLLLSVRDSYIEGTMELLGQKQHCSGRAWEDGSCTLFGELRTLRSVFAYVATGRFDEKSILLDLKYDHGVFRLTGQSVE